MYKKIAVFDSGVGGLGTLKLIEELGICEEIIYYADNKNVPFGDKSHEQILAIGQAVLDHLNAQNVEQIILACNTISSILPLLKSQTPVLAISDFAKKALESIAGSKSTLVVATKLTLSSQIYQKACESLDISADFISPVDFVPIVESMQFQRTEVLFAEYFKRRDYENILYACTHYPFLHEQFARYFPGARLLDPAKFLANSLANKEKSKEFQSGNRIIFQASKDTKILEHFYERMKYV